MSNSIREIVENFKKSQFFKGSVLFDEPLSLHTTMKVGGKAKAFVLPEDPTSAAFVFYECHRLGVQVYGMGGGSNLVVNDQGFDGVVVCSDLMNGISLQDSGELSGTGDVYMVCGAGVPTDSLAKWCAEEGIWGMENFAGLPGSVGGACFMNARCYDTSISDHIVWAKYIDLEKLYSIEIGTEGELSPEQIESTVILYHNVETDWDYKHSPFMDRKCYVVEACFKGTRTEGDLEKTRELLREKDSQFVEDRRAKGHFKAPSAGSVFKNNRSFGKPSGKLVDEAGLKGVSVGGAQVAPWHGNIIINNGNATAEDIRSLVKIVQDKVRETSGFDLECEIIFV